MRSMCDITILTRQEIPYLTRIDNVSKFMYKALCIFLTHTRLVTIFFSWKARVSISQSDEYNVIREGGLNHITNKPILPSTLKTFWTLATRNRPTTNSILHVLFQSSLYPERLKTCHYIRMPPRRMRTRRRRPRERRLLIPFRI